ncbi:MAG: glycosyltransferase family 4 protein [Candidatus Omnitrophica bacterium]|nr:glycosyltransferase family 4 protein [Candidatus Omnitrophota bacterium]
MVQVSQSSVNTPRRIIVRRRHFAPDCLRICVVGTRGFPHVQGGIEAHCENLYTLLAEQGHEVIVFARRQYVKIDRPYIYKRVRVVPLACVKNKFLEAFLHTLTGIVAAVGYRPDILHIHAIGPSFFAPVARLFGMKVVVTNHGPDYERQKWGTAARAFLRLSELTGLVFSSQVIAISRGIKKRHKHFAFKTSVIPNGVSAADLDHDEDIIDKFGLKRQEYILSVGRFVPEKGFLDLINAFELLQRSGRIAPGMNLVIVGKADHETAYSLLLEKRARANKNIILTGFLTGRALRQMYSHAGLFVLSSYHEGLSLALLEALGYGISCVASDIEPNRVPELESSRYYPVGSVPALVEKIAYYMAHGLTEGQKNTQISLIRERYDWELIADATLCVYRSL